MKKQFLCAILAAALLSSSAAAYPEQAILSKKQDYKTPFTDVIGTESASAVQTCYESGLMNGTSKATFQPEQIMTNAQLLVTADRLYRSFHGEKWKSAASGEQWYLPFYNDLQKAGVELPYPLETPADAVLYANDATSLWTFIHLMSAVIPENALPAINDVASNTDWNVSEDIIRFYNAGILKSTDVYGSFPVNMEVSRGQAAILINRIIDPTQRLHLEPFLPFDQCRDVLQLDPETVLLTIDGTALTAEQISNFILQKITEGWGGKNGAQQMDIDAVKRDIITNCKRSLSTRFIGTELGLTISDEAKADAKKSVASMRKSTRGVREKGWLLLEENMAWDSTVRAYYLNTYGFEDSPMVAPRHFYADLLTRADHMVVEESPEFQALDWRAIADRAYHSAAYPAKEELV